MRLLALTRFPSPRRNQDPNVAQLLSYLRLGQWRFGFLLNFDAPLMKTGIRRVVNGY